MSKKMLKRSLALGALMAFVITGSAMAAEIAPITKTKTGTGTLTISGEAGLGNAICASGDIVTVDGYSDIKLVGTWPSGGNDRNIFYVEKNGTLNIGSVSKPINIIDTSNFDFTSIVFHAHKGIMNVNADKIHIENFANGVYVQDKALVDIKANEINLKTEGEWSVLGVGSYSGDEGVSKLNINTGSLIINASNGIGVSVSEGNYGDIVGKDVKI